MGYLERQLQHHPQPALTVPVLTQVQQAWNSIPQRDTRHLMFYIDCLAQIFSELAILGAYICILVSSAQSYSIDNECVRAHETLCVAVSALIQFFFQSAFLFLMLESLLLCTALKDYLPTFCAPRSPITLMIIGFGIPAIMNIVLAAIASDEYSDGNDKYGYPM
ncbi:fibronectin type-III domain-containing protein [Trichonephila clavipes]|nr:fibronectin type-III domain-containing protein [Trichonephila clavipes]